MADNKSPAQATNLLNFLKGLVVTSPALNNVYIGLSTTLPTEDGGNFTEPAALTTGYARVQYATGVSNFSEPTNRSCFNQQEINFNVALAQYPTIVAVGIFDEAADTVPLYYGSIDLGRSIETGDRVYFPPSGLILHETQTTFTKSNFLAHAQLKLLRNETFETPIQVYLALGTNPPSTTGDITELTAAGSPGYARIPIPCNAANWSVTGRTAANLLELVFPMATAPWENIKSFALYKSAIGNLDMLYCGSFGDNNTKVIYAKDKLRIPVNSITIKE